MKLPIDNNYRIVSGSACRNYILQERKVRGENSKNPGEEYWIDQKFTGTLDQAIKNYRNEVIINSEADGLEDIIELLEDMDTKLEKIHDRLYKIGGCQNE